MDRWSRNERLYRHLLSLGLFVDPLFNDAEKTKIDCLLVSTAARETQIDIVEKVTEAPAMGSVVPPMKGPEIVDLVATAKARGDGVVIELPPVF